MTTKTQQTASELNEHYDDHLRFLMSSAESFDHGFEGEAKRLATSLRVLLHDKGTNSRSLLGQLGILDRNFLSTSIPHSPSNWVPHFGLLSIEMTNQNVRYVAVLDDDESVTRWLPFSEWWNEPIFVDINKIEISRKGLVLSVADQDGGAHVDPALNDAYARLSRQNSLAATKGEDKNPIEHPERPAVRQITHEVLKSLILGYFKHSEKILPEDKLHAKVRGIQFS
jgi:hypothetical protein